MRPLCTCFSLFFLLFGSICLHAQGWERDYPNYPPNSYGVISPTKATELTDGNFLVPITNYFDSKLYKINALGDLLAHDDSIMQHYNAHKKLYPLPDGEALVVGSWADGHYFQARLDASFQFHWLGTFNAVYGDFQRLPDGGFLTAGISASHQFLAIRLSPALDTLWIKDLNYPSDPTRTSVQISMQSDGSALIYFNRTTYQWINGFGSIVPFDQGFIQLSPSGDVLESDAYPPFDDYYWSIAFDANGQYYRWNYNTLRKYALPHTLIWEKTAAEVLGQTGLINGLTFHPDGNLNLYGDTGNYLSDLLFSKITPNGDLIWARQFGYPNVIEKGTSITNTQDGGYIVGGYRDNRVYLVRTDSLGYRTPYIVHGKVFRDDNQNCLLDSGEPPFPQVIFESATTPPMYRTPDEVGNFDFDLPAAQQNLVVRSLNPFWAPCQDTIAVDLLHHATDTVLIAVQKTVDCPLLRIGVATQGLRRCFSNSYTIDYCNEGNAVAVMPEIALLLNDSLHFDSSSLTATAIDGNHLTFSLPDLAPGDCGSIKVWFTVPCTVNLGTMLCSSVSIQPDTLCLPLELFHFEDNSPFEDQDCHTVVGAFDPNDKAAQPTGNGPTHLLARDSTLHYLIRFQNTGTDTAFTVVVRDSLNKWLDPATFRLEVASHPVVTSLSGLGVLELRFPNIMLPDSFVNERASHGFVKFSIRIRPQVPALTRIENFAAIYFDFNEPVLTNTVFHTIDRLWFSTPLDTSICQGHSLWGTFIQQDTIVVDTFTFTENYLIVTAQVTALSAYEIPRDTAVSIGQTVANQPVISSIQTIRQTFSTVEGCDSVIVWRVTGLVGTSTPAAERQLWPQPNPVHDWLSLPLSFPVGEVEAVQIGTGGGKSSSASFLPAGERLLRLNVRALSPGWYFGRVQRGDGWYVFRFVKE